MDKKRIQILYVKRNERLVKPVSDAVMGFFGLRSYQNLCLELIPSAYNTVRRQYDASSLIEFLSRSKKEGIAIWLVDQDIYVGEKQYVYGYAARDYCALVSTYRLKTDENVLKEVLHQVGHVLGAKHCDNRCVMRKSMSYEDIMSKPYRLCEGCRSQLHLR